MARLGPAFRHLWLSSGLANLADGVVLAGVPLIAVTLTRSPLLVSLVAMAGTLPWLLVSLPVGALVDRLDRRRIMVLAHWTRAAGLAAAALAALLGVLDLPVLCATVFLLGAAEVFADTAAQSVLPMIVPAAGLATANGRIMATQTVGNNFLGAPAAGLLAGLAPVAIFGGPALCYAGAALLLLGLRGRFRVERTGATTLRADVAAGLCYLRGHRTLRALALLGGTLNFANGAYFAVFVLWAVGPGSAIGFTAEGYGLVLATLAVGAVAGSLIVARLPGTVPVLIGADLVNGLLLIVPVALPAAPALFAAAAGLGLTNAVGNVLRVTLRQRLVPADLFGRVNATYRLVGMGATPLGALLGGLMGDLAGLRTVFWGAAGLCALATLLAARPLLAGPLAAGQDAEQVGDLSGDGVPA
jgi:MFS family permease